MAGEHLYQNAIEDARRAILLEPTEGMAWTLLIRCLIDSLQLDLAQMVVDQALDLFSPGAERYGMLKGLKRQIRMAKQQLGNRPRIVEVGDYGDCLCYFYTIGMIKTDQTEILAVDLPFQLGDSISARILHKLVEEGGQLSQRGSALQLGDTVPGPGRNNYWLSAIPVTDKKQVEVLRRHLMTQCDPMEKGILVLKVDKRSTPPPPLTQEQAKAYVAQIVDSAPQAKQRYNRGEKLVVLVE